MSDYISVPYIYASAPWPLLTEVFKWNPETQQYESMTPMPKEWPPVATG